MIKIKRYIRLYKELLRFSLQYYLAYRANLINSIIASVGWGAFQFVYIQLLTIRTRSAFGWTKNELIILAIVYTIMMGIFHFLFSHNMSRLSRIIDKGELDFLLLKPIDSQFFVSLYVQNYPNLIRVILGIILLFVYLQIIHLTFSLMGWVGFLCFIFFGIMLLYSLWMFYSTFLIWFPRLTNLIDFLYTIDGMARYPSEMIKRLSIGILIFVLPFTLSVATPVKILVRGMFDGDVIYLVVISIGMFLFSRAFWLYALRHYTSAGS
jgi:ABC-2 type transport system permease protein